jgi:hypothetical protein
MWVTELSVGVSAAVLLILVAGWWLGVRRRGRVAQRLDRLHATVASWQSDHGERVRSLERQVSEIERSVARAEDDARSASRQMAEIRGPLVQRLERLEHDMEIELLVAQGRIPPHHQPH